MADRQSFNLRTKLLLTLAAAAVALGLSFSPWGDAWDRFVYDALFNLRGEQPAPAEVVVVAIDQDTFSVLEIQWPWPRSIHAELIDNLFADGAAAVVFDVVFAEPSQPEEDAALAGALNDHSNVIMAVDINVVRDKSFVRQTVVGPWPELLGPETRLAYINLPTDPDGFIRRLRLRNGDYRAMALSAASLLSNPEEKKHLDNMAPGDASLGIDYLGPSRTIKTVSYYQALLPDHLPKGFFKDKLVFVGLASTLELDAKKRLADYFPTPYTTFGGGYMAGVEIHAQAAASLLAGRSIAFLPSGNIRMAGLILGLLSALVFFRLKPLPGGLIVLFLLAAAAAATWLLFRYRLTYLPVATLVTPLAGVYLVSPFIHYWQTFKDRAFIRKAFSTYVAPSVVDQLLDSPELLQLGGHKQNLTVLFSDIRGFTTISEKLEPEVLSRALNTYLDQMTAVVFENDGVLDKFIGDAVMAVFGAPVPNEVHAAQACRTALKMQAELEKLNPELEAMGSPPYKIGIGVNSGPMIVGNMGSSLRFDYTVIGDNVNLGSRLEGQTKYYGVGIIVSEETKNLAGDEFRFRLLDLIRVKGKDDPVAIYELVGPDEGPVPDTVGMSAEIFAKYRSRDFAGAAELLDMVIENHPDDQPSLILRRRCLEFVDAPPPDDWDGVETKSKK